MIEKNEIIKSPEMKELEEKVAMLVQTGRIDNLIDLFAVISDNIEITTAPMVHKMMETVDKLGTVGFVTENAMRGAKRETMKNEVPSLFGMLKLLKDEDTRRGLTFMLNLMKGIGKQL